MSTNRLRESSTAHLVRMAVFYLAVVAFLALLLLIFAGNLLNAFLVWFDPAIAAEAGIHFVHLVTFIWMIWIFGLAMLVQLYRPRRRVGAMQVALVIAVFAIVTELIAGTFEPLLAVFLGPVFVAAAAHPARSELLSRGAVTEGIPNPILLALAGVAAIPVALYVVGQMDLQLTLADEHADLAHYSSMAAYGLTFVSLAALAAFGGTGLRFAAYAAGVMAVVLAAASMFQPTASAIGGTWATFAVVWGVAVVAAFEWSVRRTASRRDETPVEDPTVMR